MEITVNDINYLVAHLFGGGPAPVCLTEADADGEDGVDIADLSLLVDYLFGGGDPPAFCP